MCSSDLEQPQADVLGRYAYAVYNEGGLLDVNVAGYPSSLANTEELAGKGPLAYADLTTLGLSKENVDNIVGWRNFATAQPPDGQSLAGGFDFTGDDGSATRYDEYIRNARHGFLHADAHTISKGRTDQLFSSRQALLQFAKATDMPPDALQYLGTFSRALEQPSFRPDPDRPKNTTVPLLGSNQKSGGGNDAYDSTGELQNRINPVFLEARFPDGELVVKQRFPLSRLALLQPNPDPETAEKILQYFGLTWDSNKVRWIYDHGNPNQILKLSEIAALPESQRREPDFFELLKAAIHCGSLGKQHGGNDAADSPSHYYGKGPGRDGSVNYQIMQIGANIIDQYDADSYPTHIHFDPPNTSGTYDLHEFYGVENIPYLAGWMSAWYRTRQLTAAEIADPPPTAAPGKNGMPYETRVLVQPIIWNPHAPDAPAPSAQTPTQFRVAAGGCNSRQDTVYPKVTAPWWDVPTEPEDMPDKPPMTKYFYPHAAIGYNNDIEVTVDIDRCQITFQTQTDGAATFREPYRLQSPNYPTGSLAHAYAEGQIIPINADELSEAGTGTAIGFYMGKAGTGP